MYVESFSLFDVIKLSSIVVIKAKYFRKTSALAWASHYCLETLGNIKYIRLICHFLQLRFAFFVVTPTSRKCIIELASLLPLPLVGSFYPRDYAISKTKNSAWQLICVQEDRNEDPKLFWYTQIEQTQD